MRKTTIFILSCALFFSCKKYLNINSDPDTTQQPSNSSVLPPILAGIPTALQVDGGTYVAKYIQNWLTGSAANQNAWDLQGYSWSAGTAASTWQMTYITFGNNVSYILEKAKDANQPEFMGVGLALRAWAYQHTTDYNSDIIFYDAFNPTLSSFRYNSQDTVYRGIDSICRDAIGYLNTALNTPGSSGRLAKGDIVYGGDIGKWKRFVFSILARNYNHVSNKTSIYKPDAVISFCDSAMASPDDDFCVPFDATQNGNSNYFGTYRNNMTNIRQSNFIVNLLGGLVLTGNTTAPNRDPRMAQMLVCSNDTTNGNGGYRGVDPGQGDPYYALLAPSQYVPTTTNYKNAVKKVPLPWGDSTHTNPGVADFSKAYGKYLFQNKAVFPVVTYSEMQFVKAEAAFRKGDKAMAYSAFLKGINGHFDFINKTYRNGVPLYTGNPISSIARNNYLKSKNVPQISDTLHMTHIMLQKYIAMWGWGFIETWTDMRRFHYVDLDPETGNQVYNTFRYPQPFFGNNNGLPVYRVRPHFTSEYTYDRDALVKAGVISSTYHTKEMWFSIPD